MELKYYIYAHYAKDSGTPFYIGVGTKLRAYDCKKRSVIWKRYMKKHGLVIKILQENLNKETAMSTEKQLIKEYGRINNGTGVLVNLTDGGEGTYGIIRSEETRKKLSEAQKKNTHSEETKDKLRKINTGKTHSEETKLKISKAMTGKTHTKETREKMRKLLTGRVMTEEHRRNHKEAMKKWFASRKKI